MLLHFQRFRVDGGALRTALVTGCVLCGWLSVAPPTAQGSELGATAKKARGSVIQPSEAPQPQRVRPGDRNAINPQPLPPSASPISQEPQAPANPWGSPVSGRKTPDSMRHEAACRPRTAWSTAATASNSDPKAMSPDSLTADCSQRIRSIDEQIGQKMKTQAKAFNGRTTPKGSQQPQQPAGSVVQGAELDMIRIQSQQSQHQQAVQMAEGLIQNLDQCVPKCAAAIGK